MIYHNYLNKKNKKTKTKTIDLGYDCYSCYSTWKTSHDIFHFREGCGVPSMVERVRSPVSMEGNGP